jgi:hypothetical protein
MAFLRATERRSSARWQFLRSNESLRRAFIQRFAREAAEQRQTVRTVVRATRPSRGVRPKYISRTVGYPTISAQLTSYCLSLRPSWSIAEFALQQVVGD